MHLQRDKGVWADLCVVDELGASESLPCFQADKLVLQWDWTQYRDRFFPLLYLESPRFLFHIDEMGATNIDFFQRFQSESVSSEYKPLSERWLLCIPEQLELRKAGVSGSFPWGKVGLNTFDAVLTLPVLQKGKGRLTASQSQLDWTDSAGEQHATIGDLEADLHWAVTGEQRDVFSGGAQARVDFPGWAQGAFEAQWEGGLPEVEGRLLVEDCCLEASISTFFLQPLTQDNVGFERFLLEKGAFFYSPQSTQAELSVRVAQLRLGGMQAPWYQGEVAFSGTGQYRDDVSLSLSGTLAQQQAWSMRCTGTLGKGEGEARLGPWTAQQVVALLPERYRTFFPQCSHVQGRIAGEWATPEHKVEGVFQCSADGVAPLILSLETDINQEKMLGSILANLEWKQQQLLVSGTRTATGSFKGEAQFQKMALGMWASQWLAARLPLPSITLNGAIKGEQAKAEAPYVLNLEMQVGGLGKAGGAFQLPEPLGLRGELQVAANLNTASGEELSVSLGDATKVSLSQFEVVRTPLHVQGTAQLDADLSELGSWLERPSLWGEISGRMPFTWEGTAPFSGKLSWECDTLGYGDLGLPYGTPLTGGGEFVVSSTWDSASVKSAFFALGEGTTVHIPNASAVLASPETGTWRANLPEVRLETDLQPLCAKGYLQRAQGHLSGIGKEIVVTPASVMGDFSAKGAFEQLVLRDNWATLDTAALQYQGNCSKEAECLGQGDFSVASIRTGGVSLSGISGALALESEFLRVSTIEMSVFDGQVVGNAAWWFKESGFPIQFRGYVRNVDLATFTQEFKPPSIVLTGRVRGDVSIGFSNKGIHQLAVNLRTVGGFSLNRDMVEQILLSQYVQGVSQGKTLSAVVQKIIGEDEQRPFDSAHLVLGLENGRITGQARLKSEALTLTVDIKADPEALLEALRIRQEET